MNTTFTGGWRQFRAVHTLEPVTKGYWTWSVNGMQTFLLPRKSSAELSRWFNSTGYNGSIRNGAVGAMNVGIKKELNKDRGTLQLAVSDVLTTIKFTSMYGATTREAFDIKNKVQFYTEPSNFPVFRLTYLRSFGVKAKSRGVNGSSEERNRINR